MNELTRVTGARYEALTASRQQVDHVRAEFEQVHRLHADASRLRESMAAERMQIESFIERTIDVRLGVPELQARIDAVAGRLASLDDSQSKGGSAHLAPQPARRASRSSDPQRQLVEQLEARLTSLSALASETDRRLEEQHARRAELDAIRSRIDGVTMKAAETVQKLDDVSAARRGCRRPHEKSR